MIEENLELITKIGTEIEDLVYLHDISYIDACILYCEDNDVEIELLAKVIKDHQPIKANIRREAEKLNCVQAESTVVFEYTEIKENTNGNT